MNYWKSLSLILVLSTGIAYGMEERGRAKFINIIQEYYPSSKQFPEETWQQIISKWFDPLIDVAQEENESIETIVQFNIIVDGFVQLVTFHEGSNIAIEGKNIAIKQITPGRMIKGTWKIIQQPEIAAYTLPWAYVPRVNTDLLIAVLKDEQEFLLSINYTSTNCTNTSMTVLIDGQPIRDNANNIITFWEGSTLYGKGKTVAIRPLGTCTGNNTINGDLKLKK